MSSTRERTRTRLRQEAKRRGLIAEPFDFRSVWTPQAGPQELAFHSEADIVYYGGAAGGGKTDLALGLALCAHTKSVIFRREQDLLEDAIERSKEIIDGHGRFNHTTRKWTFGGGKSIKFAGCQREEDKEKWKGRPHDLYVFDEVPDFSESMVRFITGWNRTTRKGQRCRIVLTGNPPMTADGEWLITFFGPWLDPNHPNPAKPGEMRWYATIDGKDVERPDGEPFEHNGEMFRPKSRTFILALLKDNAYLADTGYADTVNALPEPLRSWLKGNFHAGRTDDPWQVIPSEWVDQAIKRGREQPAPPEGETMDALGVDVARGGRDRLVMAPRWRYWFGPLHVEEGVNVPDGWDVAGRVLPLLEEGTTVNIDIIGVGTSPYDILKAQKVDINGINFGAGSDAKDRSKKLKMRNVRAAAWWGMRELLDPTHQVEGEEICLPDDPGLRRELTAPKWKMTIGGVLIEEKARVISRTGRSTDLADAVILAAYIAKKRKLRWT